MRQYRKRPVIVKAEQFEWEDGRGIPDIPGVKFEEWREVQTLGGAKYSPVVATAYVETLEGKLHVSRGDWIVEGVEGERYPCKPSVFQQTYDPVDLTQGEGQ